MKIGTLCKVVAKHSHSPSQFGDLVVISARLGCGLVICGTNLKTGKKHHYAPKELEEVKK